VTNRRHRATSATWGQRHESRVHFGAERGSRRDEDSGPAIFMFADVIVCGPNKQVIAAFMTASFADHSTNVERSPDCDDGASRCPAPSTRRRRPRVRAEQSPKEGLFVIVYGLHSMSRRVRGHRRSSPSAHHLRLSQLPKRPGLRREVVSMPTCTQCTLTALAAHVARQTKGTTISCCSSMTSAHRRGQITWTDLPSSGSSGIDAFAEFHAWAWNLRHEGGGARIGVPGAGQIRHG